MLKLEHFSYLKLMIYTLEEKAKLKKKKKPSKINVKQQMKIYLLK